MLFGGPKYPASVLRVDALGKLEDFGTFKPPMKIVSHNMPTFPMRLMAQETMQHNRLKDADTNGDVPVSDA